MMRTNIFIFLAFLFSFLPGCSDSSSVVNNTNVISTKSVNDTLAVSITATNYTHDEDINLLFSVDTVKLSLSIVGYGSGYGMFKIFKDTNTVYSKDLSSNVQSIQLLLPARPTKASITLSNYKGNASILLTR